MSVQRQTQPTRPEFGSAGNGLTTPARKTVSCRRVQSGSRMNKLPSILLLALLSAFRVHVQRPQIQSVRRASHSPGRLISRSVSSYSDLHAASSFKDFNALQTYHAGDFAQMPS
ncbi:hypothetical protein CDAR_525791 [Caerostris darwini]|uniref:Uncharacterized protein n=1 Tax=Caerostris darwini TaxID=1538125 RepID=A0AAV4V728_9ARAC|nr:hypothetical protein CDAR_525791 [Caerostris darwini]